VENYNSDFSHLEPLERLIKTTGHGYQMTGAMILSQLPVECHFDEDFLLHNAIGSAMRWEDGTAIYSWHGVCVPSHVIMQKIISKRSKSTPNLMEARRVIL